MALRRLVFECLPTESTIRRFGLLGVGGACWRKCVTMEMGFEVLCAQAMPSVTQYSSTARGIRRMTLLQHNVCLDTAVLSTMMITKSTSGKQSASPNHVFSFIRVGMFMVSLHSDGNPH